jgi:ribosomal protein S18 acetylase RimI-like enzyme
MTAPPDVSVAPGRMDDAERVADLWVALAADQRRHGSHLLAEPNRTTVLDSVHRHAVTGGLVVARNDDETVVGFVTFGPDTGSYEQTVERGVVENIYVVPDRRGEGIGAALMSAAERTLAEAGADVVSLEVMADNGAARRFYRRQGYAPHRVTLERSVESDTHSKPDD